MTDTPNPETPNGGVRAPLPSRRPSITRKLHWPPEGDARSSQSIYVTIGYDPKTAQPREIFYDSGYKSGSDMETLVSDLCIAISVFLQHEHITPDVLSKSMSQSFSFMTGKAAPASILGMLLDELRRPIALDDTSAGEP